MSEEEKRDERWETEGPGFRDRLVGLCGAPARFVDLRIEDLDDGGDGVYRAAVDRVVELGRALRGAIPEEGSYVLLEGPMGAGKTRLAVWLLRQVYAGVLDRLPGSRLGATAETRPLFVTAYHMGELRFRRFSRGEDEDDGEDALRERLFTSRFLVLDDLTRLASYKGEAEFIGHVVEERYNSRLSTLLTCNVLDVDVALGPRFADFLAYFERVVLVGKTRRERLAEHDG